MSFLAENSPPPIYRPSVGGAEARLDVSGAYEEHEVTILDGRKLPETFRLDQQGFQLLRHESSVTDMYDVDQRSHIYEAECREIVAAATGATRVHYGGHGRVALGEFG